MIILITGASHTGKTALAQKLLEKYKYPYLSIDHLKMGLVCFLLSCFCFAGEAESQKRDDKPSVSVFNTVSNVFYSMIRTEDLTQHISENNGVHWKYFFDKEPTHYINLRHTTYFQELTGYPEDRRLFWFNKFSGIGRIYFVPPLAKLDYKYLADSTVYLFFSNSVSKGYGFLYTTNSIAQKIFNNLCYELAFELPDNLLTNQLKNGYCRTDLSYNSENCVLVIGQVKNIGIYAIDNPTSLSAIIKMAGGISESHPGCARTAVIVRKPKDGQEQNIVKVPKAEWDNYLVSPDCVIDFSLCGF